MSIQVLSSSVIDKIAAGEVLERPAQLVKELVENSIDAEAKEVQVEISSGGRQILVKDDGKGIPAGEMELALQRHATSKIQKVEDLFALSSFGFRGEALSSAGSVSHLVMTSRPSGQEMGHQLNVEFGKVKSQKDLSASFGSEIQVSQLFDNVPARKKFLKSDGAEVGQIKLSLKSFGLAHPQVTFRVSLEGNLLWYWDKTESHLQRVQDVLGLDELYFVQGEESGISVRAFYGAPNKTLRQNRGLWLFVQGRWVQDRSLAAAIMESYRSLLMHGEYPHCVLFVDLPSSDVDVNVHPTKSQVRFAQGSDVFRAVVHTLRKGLETTPWLKKNEGLGTLPHWEDKNEEREIIQNPSSFSQMTFLDREIKKTSLQSKQFALKSPAQDYKISIEDLKQAAPPAEIDFQWGRLQVLGQLAQTYILAQSENEFYLVDQHAAHERVVYERLMKNWKQGQFVRQSYLIPLTLDFSNEEVEVLLGQKEELEKMGISIEQAGPETLAVTSAPEIIKDSAVAKALSLFSEQIRQNGGSFAVENVIGEVFASMSCHSVVRAGQALSADEMKSLLVQMDEFPFSSFCPHGRPVFVKKTLYQIDREFGRIV